MDDFLRIPEHLNFPKEEDNTLKYWNDNKVFENCLKQSKDKPRYTFYDGPPFATGLPHYGHILAGTIKDVVTRYAHQQGYHVERRFGWDCHGLPVEYEIDKDLNIKGPEDVARMGIRAYNNECRKIVMRYADEWEKIIGRMGRWIDFKNDYKSLYPWYMESIWWIFQQIFQKGLVYRGVKVMPYSTACTTALSNFESGQNYKDVVDPFVVITFPMVGSDVSFLAWTTTPWTLPSNLALCVNPEMTYVRVCDVATKRRYILAESRLSTVFKPNAFTIEESFLGATLAGVNYEPCFEYFREFSNAHRGFRVLCDLYVTEDSGTGIVHQAAYFGEDDFRVCMTNGVISRDDPSIVCPVDASGRFTDDVPDFHGQYVKDADKNIIANLKARERLFSVGQVKHSYPFCWRSDTPLIYKAVPSWFIRVEQMAPALIAATGQTYWVPDFVKEKRFGNWLRESRDWAFSRNRYWGTPIPLWISEDGQEIVCIGSIRELQQYTTTKITDLHRENIDDIVIPSKRPGHPPLRRIPEVFDCWFESGSMPFAQQHYPFENRSDFSQVFPADFIAEGIDQTRGWFYTLIVISTCLFNRAPFKNLIANGLILAADGQKMSKRKKNYPDPMEIVNKYGADALRLYLINSPVVRAENLRFKEDGVRDVIKDVFLPWYNAWRFLFQNIDRLAKEENIQYRFDRDRYMANRCTNIMDTWITSFKESLLEFVRKEMQSYRLYTVVPRLTKFIDQLTNWYVRLNRRRIKGEFGRDECYASLDTLYSVLDTMVKMMAPFTPFLSEFMFQRLVKMTTASSDTTAVTHDSVHYQMMPVCHRPFVRSDIERSVSRMQSVIELGRVLRDRNNMPVKYPVAEIVVIHKDPEYLQEIRQLESFVLGELNARQLITCNDKDKYGVKLRAEPDHKTLGLRLKGTFKATMAAIKALDDAAIQSGLDAGYFTILDQRIELSEIRIIYCLNDSTNDKDKKAGHLEAHSDNDVLVLMDLSPSDELLEEGIAREIINRVQKLKKKGQLLPTDPVTVYYSVTKPNTIVAKVAQSHHEFIQTSIKSQFIEQTSTDNASLKFLLFESYDLKDANLTLGIVVQKNDGQSAPSSAMPLPVVTWANCMYGTKRGTILLQNSDGQYLSVDTLYAEIDRLFRLYGRKITLSAFDAVAKKLAAIECVDERLGGKTIVVSVGNDVAVGGEIASGPFVRYTNVNYDGRQATILLENPVGCNLERAGYVSSVLKLHYPNTKDIGKILNTISTK